MKDKTDPVLMEIEIRTPDNKKSMFAMFDLTEGTLWTQMDFYPTAFLCAGHDGEPIMSAKCGKKGDLDIQMLRVDWLINQWGGPTDMVDALKKFREKHMAKLPEYRVKYGVA